MTATILKRETFKTDRALEFFSEKELQMQIGHSRRLWPLALVKELIDNSLDACETAGILPEIEITVEQDSVSVKDNGPGLPAKTLEQSLNYMIRVSDKNHYISPSRGQLGNALKCVWAVPFVFNGEYGRIDVITGGKLHEIDVSVDRIAQKPKLQHVVSNNGFVKNGTFVKIYLPEIAGILENIESDDSYNSPTNIFSLIGNYTAFNPHASFFYKGYKFESTSDRRSVDTWQKWNPFNPTSAHWYSVEQLRNLISAYLNIEREGNKIKTVREFVSEFKGLSSTLKQKRVTDAAGLSRAYLYELIKGDDVDIELVERLLIAMQDNSQPVKPKALGVIGEDHFKKWMIGNYTSENSIKYKMVTGKSQDLPFVLEAAFGVNTEEYSGCGREIATGLNWSPALKMPFSELSQFLHESYVDSYDPVCLAVHLACPKLDFTDRGKGKLQLPLEIQDALQKAVESVTKIFSKAKRKIKREERLQDRALEKMRQWHKKQKLSVRDAAFEVMEKAYMKASSNGTLPANARQVMYAARPLVIELTGKSKPWSNSAYFTQTLLPEFIEANPEITEKWDVVYDARGKFIEPHTEMRVDLGTLEVRQYINEWSNDVHISNSTAVSLPYGINTHGPVERYKFVLFVEKEGFNELWKSVNLANRYDMAIMSTKGMSVTAARSLVENLTEKGVTILVLRDFDKAGFSIIHTLQTSTRRYKYNIAPNVVDLGLRLEDVKQMDLESEDVTYTSKVDPCINLLESGATENEADFLVCSGFPKAWKGKRVEINAMDSGQLVEWLESKLEEVGVCKVIPDEKVLAKAFKRAHKIAHIEREIEKVARKYEENYNDSNMPIPEHIQKLIEKEINGSGLAWDDAIKAMAARTL